MQDRSNDTHTTDGVEITPGLWVWNNNLDSVQVDPKQFATDEDRARLYRRANPDATVYSEVWYDMLNGEGQRSSTMNGTRMATVFEGLKAADHPGAAFGDVKWSKIAGPKAEFLTRDQARELLSAESGTRPRIYGYDNNSQQIVKLTSVEYLDRYDNLQRIWLSGTTLDDLISKG